jgi:hypothetical protein
MCTIQPSESIFTDSTTAVSPYRENLHHEFCTLSLLVTMAATISNPAQYHPQLKVDINKEEDSGLYRLLPEPPGIAYQSSIMHAMTEILVLHTEVLAGMNYIGDRPHMLIADEKVVTRDDVETLKLAVTPNPDLHRDQLWDVEYKDRGCVRGPAGKSLWDQVKASDRGFYVIDANIR